MKKLVYILSLLIVLSACNQTEKKPERTIEQLENELFSEDAVLDQDARAKAEELVQAYIDFAENNPENPVSPDYLFKAGNVAMNIYMSREAIDCFNAVIVKYPDFEKAPESLFLVAYIFENQLQNFGKAKELYEQFITTYPDNEFADDAEMSIQNMGRSPEELIKEFEKNK